MAVMLWHGNSSMIYSVASPEELLPPSSGKAKVVRSYTQQSAQSNQPNSAVTAGEYIAKSEWIPRQTLSPSSSILQQRNDMEKKNKEMKKPLSESTAKTLDKKQTLMMKDSNTQGVALPKSEIFDPIAWLSLSTQEVIKTSNIKISESIDTKTVDLYKHTEVPLQKYYEVVEIHKETPEINTKEKEKRIQTVSHMQLQRHRVKRDMIPKVYKEISFIHGIKITKTFCDVIENLLQLEFSYQEILEMDSKILKWLIDQRKVSSSISHILKTIETKKVHGNLLSKENSELFFTHVKEVKQIHQRKNVLKTLKSILHIEPNEMKYLKSLKHLKLQNAISNVYLLRKLGFSNAEIKSCLCILSHTGDTLKAAHTKMVSDGRLSNLNMENGTQRINALNYTIEVLMKEDREKSHH